MVSVWSLFHGCLGVSSCVVQGEKGASSLPLDEVSRCPKRVVVPRFPSETLQTAAYAATLGVLHAKQ